MIAEILRLASENKQLSRKFLRLTSENKMEIFSKLNNICSWIKYPLFILFYKTRFSLSLNLKNSGTRTLTMVDSADADCVSMGKNKIKVK